MFFEPHCEYEYVVPVDFGLSHAVATSPNITSDSIRSSTRRQGLIQIFDKQALFQAWRQQTIRKATDAIDMLAEVNNSIVAIEASEAEMLK